MMVRVSGTSSESLRSETCRDRQPTQSNTKAERALVAYRDVLRKARRADAIEGTPDVLEEGTWLGARR